MNSQLSRFNRGGALLAINLLFLSIWGFAAISKLMDGIPPWFDGKFGKTFLASFPGLTVTFWALAVSEVQRRVSTVHVFQRHAARTSFRRKFPGQTSELTADCRQHRCHFGRVGGVYLNGFVSGTTRT